MDGSSLPSKVVSKDVQKVLPVNTVSSFAVAETNVAKTQSLPLDAGMGVQPQSSSGSVTAKLVNCGGKKEKVRVEQSLERNLVCGVEKKAQSGGIDQENSAEGNSVSCEHFAGWHTIECGVHNLIMENRIL